MNKATSTPAQERSQIQRFREPRHQPDILHRQEHAEESRALCKANVSARLLADLSVESREQEGKLLWSAGDYASLAIGQACLAHMQTIHAPEL